MRTVICGGIRYDDIQECADRTEYSIPQLYHALHSTGRVGYDAVSYGDDASAAPARPAGTPLLRAGYCTYRLGASHGGRY